MASAAYDVTGIGNAIVDVIAHADDAFLAANAIEKGAMTLIDSARAEELYGRMGPGVEVSGGSAGNTMAGIALLGGAGAYIGKVAKDQLGDVFGHDIRASGVAFASAPLLGGAPTARCLILVTPDAQRSMNTYLGACVELGPEDVDEALIASSQVTYLEGYLWDPPGAKEAFRKAAAIAHAAGRKVSLSLSDSFCVHRHHAEFVDLVETHVDILFANEHEIGALYGTDRFEDALEAVKRLGKTAALTRSEKGSVIVSAGSVVEVPAEPVGRVVDTTGAGDLYASGFLFGFTRDLPPAVCGRIGAIAAGEIISHVGARPEADLRALIAAKGLL
ncbi:adenosine kinase [Azospirillum agricola]|uniref:adenosine kinase n=1 Tax=Azospirillum agricola TaxID=1720247 RepID=UPI000A0F15DC|nr:adenosine kinase [Azospirillum agricola]SMH55636.1 Sugar or nucleoside kinase, ribokinase family [Azospirillum lipoferum]